MAHKILYDPIDPCLLLQLHLLPLFPSCFFHTGILLRTCRILLCCNASVWILLMRSSFFKLWLNRVLRVSFLVTFLSKVDPLLSPNPFVFLLSHTTFYWVNTSFQLYFQNIYRIPPLLSIPISATLAKPPSSMTQMIVVSTCHLLPHLCSLHTLCSSLINLLINSSDASCQGLVTCFASAWNVGHLDRSSWVIYSVSSYLNSVTLVTLLNFNLLHSYSSYSPSLLYFFSLVVLPAIIYFIILFLPI